jgi:hypothetical protein
VKINAEVIDRLLQYILAEITVGDAFLIFPIVIPILRSEEDMGSDA